MQIYRTFLLFFTISLALSISIDSDSYLNLSNKGYSFSFLNFKAPVVLEVTGLPDGVAVKDLSIVPVGDTAPGQYIVSVKATDASKQKDEKIVILNIDQGVKATPKAQISSSVVQTNQQTSSLQVNSTSSGSSISSSSSYDISSIAAAFQPQISTTQTTSVSTSSNSLDSLQDFFNQIDTTNAPSNSQSSNLNTNSNNLNSILTDFSNANSAADYQKIISNMTVTTNKTLITQTSIDLNFNDSQKAIVSSQANALFERQKLAAEYVAGNYSIVMQLTANKNMLNNLISDLTVQYQKDQSLQKSVGLQLNKAIENKTKIDSAISNLNGFMITLRDQILASKSKVDSLKLQQQNLTGEIKIIASNTNQTTFELNNLQNQFNSANSALSSNNNKCDSLNTDFLQANKSLSIYTSQMGLIDLQVTRSLADITSKQATVQNLMKQLAQAQKDLDSAKQNSTNLVSQKQQLVLSISTVNSNISAINQNINACSNQTVGFKQSIQTLQTSITSKQVLINQLNNQNTTLNNQLNSLINTLSQQTGNYNNLLKQNDNALSAQTLLKNALPQATDILQQMVNKKGQIDLSVQNGQASLNAAIARFKSESYNLTVATMNLQNARALSSKADNEVNSYLANKGNILPYAVAVNSTQSALIGQTIISPSISITNWFNYLTANFGTVAFPYASQQVQCLYPVNLGNLRNDVVCPGDDGIFNSLTGKVDSIPFFNQIIVKVDGLNSKETIDIPSCASITSIVSSYKPAVGDSVIVKGISSKGKTTAKSIIFLKND